MMRDWDFLSALFGGTSEPEIDPALEQFRAYRKHQRGVVESAAIDWLMTTGMWEPFLEQTEYPIDEYGEEYVSGVRFDPRRPRCREIQQFVSADKGADDE